MWIIAWNQIGYRGWCVVDFDTREILAGPFANFEEAEENIRTRSFRLAQGWAP